MNFTKLWLVRASRNHSSKIKNKNICSFIQAGSGSETNHSGYGKKFWIRPYPGSYHCPFKGIQYLGADHKGESGGKAGNGGVDDVLTAVLSADGRDLTPVSHTTCHLHEDI